MDTTILKLQQELIQHINNCENESVLRSMLVKVKSAQVPLSREEYVTKVRAGKASLDAGRYKTQAEMEEKFVA